MFTWARAGCGAVGCAAEEEVLVLEVSSQEGGQQSTAREVAIPRATKGVRENKDDDELLTAALNVPLPPPPLLLLPPLPPPSLVALPPPPPLLLLLAAVAEEERDGEGKDGVGWALFDRG